MVIKLSVLGIYAAALFAVGWWARSKWSASPENYFLADRRLGPVIFLFTMAATNFSAFTVFGASGAGYRDGYAFYPVMGFGTGFMALTFWIIGRKARSLGIAEGALTPPGLVRSAYNSRNVSTLFASVMIIFTIPYLALQPIAAGYALEELLGLPHIWGAAAVTAIICIYTLRGGLRAVAWTDALQGLLMFFVLAVALVLIAGQMGGLSEAGKKLLEIKPELFSRPGGQGTYLPGIWFSYILLWFFCDPMFPQLFQRFLAARDETVIRKTMCFYPLVCSAVFLLPVTIGVLGHLSHPDLAGKAADKILPLLAADMNNQVLGTLIIACGLAALMSTMDSQLLTLSSIFSQDIVPLFSRKEIESTWPGRLFVIVLSLCGFFMAVNPPGTILAIARQTFTGLAVLFPTVLFGLHPGWKSAKAAALSIIAGEGALILSFFNILPSFGFLAVVPVMIITFSVYLLCAGYEKAGRREKIGLPVSFLASPYTYAFGLIFLLAHDWWRWGEEPGLVFGWPSWIFYFLFLSLLQTILMVFWTKDADAKEAQESKIGVAVPATHP